MLKLYSLFSMPSFFRDAGRVLDLGSTMAMYNYSNSPEEADCEALRSDWVAVGNDISVAVDKYGDCYGKSSTTF